MNRIRTVLFILCLCLGLSGCKEKAEAPEMPAFEAATLDGGSFSSEAIADARLTMINVWATYCNPCLQEMPDLGEISKEYDSTDFQLLGIVSDVIPEDEEGLALARELAETTGADYPHLLLNQELYEALLTQVNAVPTTFFFDGEGTLLDTVVGARSGDAWRTIIDEYLENL